MTQIDKHSILATLNTIRLNEHQEKLILNFINSNPHLADQKYAYDILNAAKNLTSNISYNSATLFTCGNGGSQTDALHIVGELCKSFEMKRPLPDLFKNTFYNIPSNINKSNIEILMSKLESGFSAITLGANAALYTAICNDIHSDFIFAQELLALNNSMKDIQNNTLLAISTSGNANNCIYAVETANILNMYTICLTGPDGGKMNNIDCNILVKTPGGSTAEIQENHIKIWHFWCKFIEASKFTEKR
jgi:D-sedoheptulose 7-phosphate isomerase